MADIPRQLWPGQTDSLPAAQGLKDSEWRVLGALWSFVHSSAAAEGPSALWPARAAGKRPGVWPSAKTLMGRTERKESAVRNALRELTARGLLSSEDVLVGTRPVTMRWLMDPEGADAEGTLVQVHAGAGVRVGAGSTTVEVVPPAVNRGGDRAVAPAPTSRPLLRLIPAPACRGDKEVERVAGAAAAPGASEGSADADECTLVQVHAGAGVSEMLQLLGELTASIGLLSEVRAVRGDDPAARDRVTRLLALPCGLSSEQEAEARRTRWDYVAGILRRYAEIVRTGSPAVPCQRKFWGPKMLEFVPRPGRAMSAWEAVEDTVGRAEAAEAALERGRQAALAEKKKEIADAGRRPSAETLAAETAALLERLGRGG